jgi:hypothetical protein
MILSRNGFLSILYSNDCWGRRWRGFLLEHPSAPCIQNIGLYQIRRLGGELDGTRRQADWHVYIAKVLLTNRRVRADKCPTKHTTILCHRLPQDTARSSGPTSDPPFNGNGKCPAAVDRSSSWKQWCPALHRHIKPIDTALWHKVPSFDKMCGTFRENVASECSCPIDLSPLMLGKKFSTPLCQLLLVRSFP